jgi:hypothetical protein
VFVIGVKRVLMVRKEKSVPGKVQQMNSGFPEI